MPKPIHNSLPATLLLLAAGGASSSARPPVAHADPPRATPSKTATQAHAAQNSTCPTDIPGTAIVATPSREGAELLFFAPRHAIEMRRRVRGLASMQGRALASPQAASASTSALTNVSEPTASVRDVRGGAVLRLMPRNLDQLVDVQAHALEYAQNLAGDACPLLRDTPVIPEDTKKAAAPASMQMPPGIVPGVGGIGSGPLTSVPGLGF